MQRKARTFDANESGRSPKGRRRGSALVIAVGALALIAVFAAIYVTIGQVDQRVAQTVERRGEQRDVENSIADWINEVVSSDRLALYFEKIPVVDFDGDIAFSQRAVREAHDNPLTDALVMSQALPRDDVDAFDRTDEIELALLEAARFNAPGTHRRPSVPLDLTPGGSRSLDNDIYDRVDFRGATADNNLDRSPDWLWVPSDPWLASSEPSFAGFSHAERVYSRWPITNPAAARPRPELFFMDDRDWRQITNIAPDGRFVNLWNLRNNFEAGFGFGGDPADTRGNEMSFGLSLLKPDLYDPEIGLNDLDPLARLQATRQLPLGISIGFGEDPETDANRKFVPTLDSTLEDLGYDGGLAGLPETLTLERFPIWTTMYQRFMYFPLNGTFTIVDRNGFEATPGSIDFPDYQYADADGDGMADSRWYEAVDAYLPERVRRLIGSESDEVRWFFATRIIDLSGRVNVNTAADALAAPTSVAPAGMTPAEIDLRRVLSNEDPAMLYQPYREIRNRPDASGQSLESGGTRGTGPAIRLSFRDIEQPSAPGAFLSFGNPAVHAGDYTVGWADLDFTVINGGLGGAASEFKAPMMFTGYFGYDALRREIERPIDPLLDGRLAPPADYSGRWPDMRLDRNIGRDRLSLEWGEPGLSNMWEPVDTGRQSTPGQALSERSAFLHADSGIEPRGEETRSFEGVPLYLVPTPWQLFGNTDGTVGGTAELLFHEQPEGPGFARRQYYELLGQVDPFDTLTQARLAQVDDPASPLRVPVAADAVNRFQPRFGSFLFGLEDLDELLTFEGLNSPTTSRLERALSGRFEAVGDIDLTRLRLSPLRSNRLLSLERDTMDNTIAYDTAPLEIPDRNDFSALVNGPDDVIDAETMALNALDIRSRLTTISGGSPIRATPRTGPLHEFEQFVRLGTQGGTIRDGRRRDVFGVPTEAARLRRERINPPDIDSAFAEERDRAQRNRQTGVQALFDADAAFMNAGDSRLTFGSDPLARPNATNRTGISNPDFMLADWDAEAAIGVADIDLNRFADLGPENANNNNSVDDAREYDSHPADQGIANSLPDLFRLYTEALMPNAGLLEGRAWNTGDIEDADEKAATLFYGGVGPELALRLSAHMAVNARDSFDRDDTPTVATLLVDGRTARNAPGDPVFIGNNEAARRDLLDQWADRVVPDSAVNRFDARAFPFLEWLDPYHRVPQAAPLGVPLSELRTRLDIDELRGVIEPLSPGYLSNVSPGSQARRFADDPTDTTGQRRPRDWDGDGVISARDAEIVPERWLARDNPQLDDSGNYEGPLEIGGDRYADQAAVPNERSAVNIIGVEAQPFLTEVGMISVFTDSPRKYIYNNALGDIEILPEGSFTLNEASREFELSSVAQGRTRDQFENPNAELFGTRFGGPGFARDSACGQRDVHGELPEAGGASGEAAGNLHVPRARRGVPARDHDRSQRRRDTHRHGPPGSERADQHLARQQHQREPGLCLPGSRVPDSQPVRSPHRVRGGGRAER